jgi:hypothetical protein
MSEEQVKKLIELFKDGYTVVWCGNGTDNSLSRITEEGLGYFAGTLNIDLYNCCPEDIYVTVKEHDWMTL